ncbi:protein of unknown function [Paraburkholderia kururiensis]
MTARAPRGFRIRPPCRRFARRPAAGATKQRRLGAVTVQNRKRRFGLKRFAPVRFDTDAGARPGCLQDTSGTGVARIAVCGLPRAALRKRHRPGA